MPKAAETCRFRKNEKWRKKLFNRLSCFCVFFFLPDSLAGHKKNRTDTKTMTEDGKVAAELSAACLSIG